MSVTFFEMHHRSTQRRPLKFEMHHRNKKGVDGLTIKQRMQGVRYRIQMVDMSVFCIVLSAFLNAQKFP